MITSTLMGNSSVNYQKCKAPAANTKYASITRSDLKEKKRKERKLTCKALTKLLLRSIDTSSNVIAELGGGFGCSTSIAGEQRLRFYEKGARNGCLRKVESAKIYAGGKVWLGNKGVGLEFAVAVGQAVEGCWRVCNGSNAGKCIGSENDVVFNFWDGEGDDKRK